MTHPECEQCGNRNWKRKHGATQYGLPETYFKCQTCGKELDRREFAFEIVWARRHEPIADLSLEERLVASIAVANYRRQTA